MENPDSQSSGSDPNPIGEPGILVLRSEGRTGMHPPEHIHAYDFRQPASLAPNELRKLRLRHEEFVRSLASRLSLYLRLEVSLRLSKLQTMYYQRFTEALEAPTHVTLFKAEPLKGIGLLEIPPSLGLAIVDRLLGGAARPPEESRDLTEIETALLDQIVQIILNEWSNHWQTFQDLHPVLLGHENQAQFLQTAPHDTVVACFSIETRIANFTKSIQLAFPHYMLEPIVDFLLATSISDRTVNRATDAPKPQWNSGLDDVPVGITAEWGGLQLTAKEVLGLKPGHILMLDPQVANNIRVKVASATKFQGRLGTCGTKWAVELTQPLPH